MHPVNSHQPKPSHPPGQNIHRFGSIFASLAFLIFINGTLQPFQFSARNYITKFFLAADLYKIFSNLNRLSKSCQRRKYETSTRNVQGGQTARWPRVSNWQGTYKE